MATHRLLLETLPVSPSVSRLRAQGKINDERLDWLWRNRAQARSATRAQTLSEWRLLELLPVPAMREAGAPDQAQRRPANVFVLLRQLPPHLIWLDSAALDSAGTAVSRN
jgi:hypothetical protein